MMSDDGPSDESINFINEIKLMMFGLGDSPTPLYTTAHVIECIVLQQMRSLLELLDEGANMRGSDIITHNDVLFILRKDKHKLIRLINYINIKELKLSTKSTTLPIQEDGSGALSSIIETKFKQSSLDFLKSIGITDIEDNKELDDVKKERDTRAYETAMNLSEMAYYSFADSRKTSFAGVNLSNSRFLEWLRVRLDYPVNKIKPIAVDMLVYLAKETIAQLVDFVLILRHENNVVVGDPFSLAQQAACLPYETYGPAQRQIEGPPPIQPNEIREVLRRYWSTQNYPWGAFTLDVSSHTYQRLLILYNV